MTIDSGHPGSEVSDLCLQQLGLLLHQAEAEGAAQLSDFFALPIMLMDGKQGFKAGSVNIELIEADGAKGAVLVGLGDHLLRRHELG